ncbi:MAG: hypothetical protein ACREQW_16245 [Candidatus Binatia bacterium]
MRKVLGPVCYFLIFIGSAALLGYGWLILRIDQAQRAQQRGDTETAAKIYSQAETPFYFVLGLARVLREEYKNVSLSQVSILYGQNRTEDAFKKLEQISTTAPLLMESGEYAFWTGILLFRQALQTKDPEASVNAAKSALSEFQKGLAAQPEDWDLKYNYELVSTIFLQKERSQKREEQKVKSLLDKMRPTNDPSGEDLAPEKRG